MTNLDSILKSSDITLLIKVCRAKAMVFLVVMYECELDYKESLMKLEPIIQSEVSQKDKDHYNILTHIYGI